MRVDLLLSALFGVLIGWFLIPAIVIRVKGKRGVKGTPNDEKRASSNHKAENPGETVKGKETCGGDQESGEQR